MQKLQNVSSLINSFTEIFEFSWRDNFDVGQREMMFELKNIEWNLLMKDHNLIRMWAQKGT